MMPHIDRSLVRQPSKPKTSGAQRALHVQDVVTMSSILKKSSASELMLVPITNPPTCINVDGIQSREAKICGRHVITQSTCPCR